MLRRKVDMYILGRLYNNGRFGNCLIVKRANLGPGLRAHGITTEQQDAAEILLRGDKYYIADSHLFLIHVEKVDERWKG
jgi:hypothetical protein